MPEATSPEGTADDTALSVDQGVDAISDLLDDPVKPEPVEDEGQETDEPDDNDEEDAGDDDTNAEDGEDTDEPDEVAAGGKFVSKDAKVRLDDGTVISVGDLARNNLFQRDYTRKSEEVKAERLAVQADRDRMNEIAKALVQQREFMLQYSQQRLPKDPPREMLQTDPIGYWQQKADYEDAQKEQSTLEYHRQSEMQRMAQEAEEALVNFKSNEAKQLFEKVPEFRKPEVYNQFWTKATKVMSEKYGIPAEELSEAFDHRYYLIMRDLVRMHDANEKAPSVKQQLQQKPTIIKGGKRTDPKGQATRQAQARAEELRKTGSFDAGVRALMDFNL